MIFSDIPVEQLIVQYDSMGWTVTARGANISQMITLRQAWCLINMIRRASKLCGLKANLERI